MYRISNKKRRYSPTPIVKVNINEKGEEIIFISLLKKEEGDKFSNQIVNFLNNENNK